MTNLKNNFTIIFLIDALDDLEDYKSSKDRIFGIIKRVSENPLPNNQGGYGKPLGNKNNINLVGCLKIKLKHPPVRIIYKLDLINKTMLIISVGERDEMKAYIEATKRLAKNKK